MSMNWIEGGVCAPGGFMASGVHCGIRKNKKKKDLALIYCGRPCAAAGVYTQNKVQGAPILVCKEHLKDGKAKAILCNSGIANTCAAGGVEAAREMCALLASKLHIAPEDVLVASTGIIGQPVPMDAIRSGIPQLTAALSSDGGDAAAQAIMTTDLVKKEYALSFELEGKTVKLGGIAKGSGMIHPNMATMLAFLTTDVAISSRMLEKALLWVTERTFNRLSVDGDCSTNDMLMVLANGFAGNEEIVSEGPAYEAFCGALLALCTAAARAIAKDGEGATRLLECRVKNAKTEVQAGEFAKSVITSSLVKTAFFGADANWGRILCALGYSEGELDVDKVELSFSSAAGSILVCKNGAGVDFDEARAKEILLKDEIIIDIDLHIGSEQACAWGCDLSYDYVKINGDYRT